MYRLKADNVSGYYTFDSVDRWLQTVSINEIASCHILKIVTHVNSNGAPCWILYNSPRASGLGPQTEERDAAIDWYREDQEHISAKVIESCENQKALFAGRSVWTVEQQAKVAEATQATSGCFMMFDNVQNVTRAEHYRRLAAVFRAFARAIHDDELYINGVISLSVCFYDHEGYVGDRIKIRASADASVLLPEVLRICNSARINAFLPFIKYKSDVATYISDYYSSHPEVQAQTQVPPGYLGVGDGGKRLTPTFYAPMRGRTVQKPEELLKQLEGTPFH